MQAMVCQATLARCLGCPTTSTGEEAGSLVDSPEWKCTVTPAILGELWGKALKQGEW